MYVYNTNMYITYIYIYIYNPHSHCTPSLHRPPAAERETPSEGGPTNNATSHRHVCANYIVATIRTYIIICI